jgi:hypothetical protein
MHNKHSLYSLFWRRQRAFNAILRLIFVSYFVLRVDDESKKETK